MGIVGLRMLFDVLISFERQDIAWKVLNVEGYPGLLDMTSSERTTLAEAWDGSGSGCHCIFASPDATLYKMLGGIRVDRRGKTPVSLAPYCPGDLSFVECTQTIKEGEVPVHWVRNGEDIVYRFHIPEGITASLCLTEGNAKMEKVLLAGSYNVRYHNGSFYQQ